jgi:hypothetical protein
LRCAISACELLVENVYASVLDHPGSRSSKVALFRPSTQESVNIVPLLSRLLRGDAKLESCLIKDASHVLKGASGDHVGKIQTALLIVDNAQIHKAELRAQTYGDSTAAAVLAYKRARKIINFSYQTQADNIVGKMTIATLDSEVLRYELHAFSPNACSGKSNPPGIVG